MKYVRDYETAEMDAIEEFDRYTDAIEKAIKRIVLPDGREAEVRIAFLTDKEEWFGE